MSINIESAEFSFNSTMFREHIDKLNKSKSLRTLSSSENYSHDLDITENNSFNYKIISPKGTLRTKKVVFLFHGFNEKKWGKYIPWASLISKGTGSSVVLFPLSFHMQRVPKSWIDPRTMSQLSNERKKAFPNTHESSCWNASISSRLHMEPERFVWAAQRTYYDVIQFIEECKDGNHPLIDKDFEFDIFAYSIGGYLAQTLKLTNYKNYFNNTKLCLFCSGCTLDNTSPISKYILDSEAGSQLQSFFLNNPNEPSLKVDGLKQLDEQVILRSMFEYNNMQKLRESLLKKHKEQYYAIALKKDRVIPSKEIFKTLRGKNNEIDIRVEEIDFSRDYMHENPFTAKGVNIESVETDLRHVFDKVCDFYNG